MKLLSVHVPKAGGSATRDILKVAYGDRLVLDYDGPSNPARPRNMDPDRYLSGWCPWPNGADCVHGHFAPAKYAIPAGVFVFTILRDPVETMISTYFYWRHNRQNMMPLHEYVVANDLSLEEMARLPILRRLFSRTYFEGFDMGRMDLVGRYPDRRSALEKLQPVIGLSLDPAHVVNVTPVDPERAAAEADAALMGRLRDLLAEDLAFYERWAR